MASTGKYIESTGKNIEFWLREIAKELNHANTIAYESLRVSKELAEGAKEVHEGLKWTNSKKN